MLFGAMTESYEMGWSMWLVRPTVDIDLQSAVLSVVVSWLGGKSRFDVGVGRQVLGTEQIGEDFPRLRLWFMFCHRCLILPLVIGFL